MERRKIAVRMQNIDTGANSAFDGIITLTIEEVINAIETAQVLKWSGANLEDQYNEYKKQLPILPPLNEGTVK